MSGLDPPGRDEVGEQRAHRLSLVGEDPDEPCRQASASASARADNPAASSPPAASASACSAYLEQAAGPALGKCAACSRASKAMAWSGRSWASSTRASTR